MNTESRGLDSKYLLIKDLVDQVAAYEQGAKGSPLTMEGFITYLNKRLSEDALQKRSMAGPLEPQMQADGKKTETDIAILVTFIYRYAKLYAKKVLQHSAISGMDDFSYLIVLITHPSLSKTELIQKNVHEKTSGMEIIKRLIRLGFLVQFDDEHDKRSQRVSITNSGRVAVFSVLQELKKVSDIMTGNLSEAEKQILNNLLNKLDYFHYHIYMHQREHSLDEILKENLPST